MAHPGDKEIQVPQSVADALTEANADIPVPPPPPPGAQQEINIMLLSYSSFIMLSC